MKCARAACQHEIEDGGCAMCSGRWLHLYSKSPGFQYGIAITVHDRVFCDHVCARAFEAAATAAAEILGATS